MRLHHHLGGQRFRAGLLVVLLAAVLAPGVCRGQGGAARQQFQAGLGIIPGVGLQGGLVSPRGFYTVEGILYVDGSPAFAGGEGSVQISGGVGGALRVLGILRAIGSPGYQARDLDVGVRFGPSLFFAFGASSRDENPFGLFFDPFVRAAATLGGTRRFYAELGLQRPILRGGVVFDL